MNLLFVFYMIYVNIKYSSPLVTTSLPKPHCAQVFSEIWHLLSISPKCLSDIILKHPCVPYYTHTFDLIFPWLS